jgi:hypothetical protein
MIAETILAYSTAFNQQQTPRPAAQAPCVHTVTSRRGACATFIRKLSMRIAVHVLLVVAAISVECAHAADAPQKTFNLDIVRGTVAAPQRLLKVEKGDALKLHITSDAPGELHLHGYRLSAKLAPGQAAELSFNAYATGRYPFEWHDAGAAAATSTHHRGPPLATLEVRPK